MRYMPLDFVKPHHYLAQAIYNKHFVEQLFDDGNLTIYRVEALKKLGYHSVYVRESNRPDVDNALPHLMLSDVYTRVNHIFDLVLKIAQKWHPDKCQPIPLDMVKDFHQASGALEVLGESLAIELLRQNQPVLHLYESKSLQLYPVQHAVHTALIAMKIGLKKDLNIKSLKQLFMAAILNDIGYIFVNAFDPIKSGLLSEAKKIEQQVHVRYTHTFLSQMTEINGLVRNICLNHHEREDGLGYPAGLDAKAIHPLAKILSVAITYDALVSDRPFRPAYPLHKAVQMIQQGSGKQFEASAVALLVKCIPPFPLGTCITYQKKVGIVSSYDDTHQNPIIIFEDGSTSPLKALVDGPLGLNYQA